MTAACSFVALTILVVFNSEANAGTPENQLEALAPFIAGSSLCLKQFNFVNRIAPIAPRGLRSPILMAPERTMQQSPIDSARLNSDQSLKTDSVHAENCARWLPLSPTTLLRRSRRLRLLVTRLVHEEII